MNNPYKREGEDDAHYKDLPIQPMQYSLANKLDPAQHTAIKYITRFKSKGGKRDLIAAKHVIDMLIDHYYGDDQKSVPETSPLYASPGERYIDEQLRVKMLRENADKAKILE